LFSYTGDHNEEHEVRSHNNPTQSGTVKRENSKKIRIRNLCEEACKATIVIENKIIQVLDGHVETPDLHVTADSQTWLGFLRKERSLLWALISRKIRIKGSPRLLKAFGKCFV
jgi:putative sterol carrier protein